MDAYARRAHLFAPLGSTSSRFLFPLFRSDCRGGRCPLELSERILTGARRARPEDRLACAGAVSGWVSSPDADAAWCIAAGFGSMLGWAFLAARVLGRAFPLGGTLLSSCFGETGSAGDAGCAARCAAGDAEEEAEGRGGKEKGTKGAAAGRIAGC